MSERGRELGSKNVVICCDGTWNRFDKRRNTNVSLLAGCLIRQTDAQVVFYDPGVGTIASQRWRTRMGQAWDKLLGGAFGAGLETNILEAYSFLAEHYYEGDRIFLFGFSRGAYTVRALASILHMFGLLERRNENLYPSIREIIYKRLEMKPDFDLAARFRHNFAKTIEIHFVGAWDTVSSVGWLHCPLSLPFTQSNPSVRHVRHAVSINERRKSFRQNLFKATEEQDLKEVWFAGAHADVGGGYDQLDSGLSKLSLEWMLQEAIACGLQVKRDRITRVLGIENDDYSSPNPRATEHDQLSHLLWKLAQIVPRRTYDMKQHPPKRRWDLTVRPHHRFIPPVAKIHESVVIRKHEVPEYNLPIALPLPADRIEPWRKWNAS